MMRPVALAVLGCMLTGCAVGPDYVRPEAPMAQGWKLEPGWQAGNPADAAAKGEWWKIFGDAQLDALQEKALHEGQTMTIAQARVDQARARLAIADSDFFPLIGAQFGANRARSSAERPLTNYAVPNTSTTQNDFTAALSVGYEADLFGRVRRQSEGASANVEQARADFENTRLILTAEVASQYFLLRATDAEIALLRQTIRAQDAALDYIASRHELGAASGLDYHQQQSLTAATRSQLEQLEEQRGRIKNGIATLIGVPAPEFELARDARLAEVPPIPLAAPAALLERRPDVAAAERAMAAANARIGLARSAFFPAIELSATYGNQANQIENLFSASSLLWAVGTSVAQTLFDGGARRGNEALAEAGYQEAVASYRQTVLAALQEVQDGLTGDVLLARATISARTAADSAQKSFDLAQARYETGVAANLDVLVAQQMLIGYRREEVQLTGRRLLNSVRLIKALGGGWNAS